MPTNVSTILIDATRQQVWDVITKAELVKLWQFGSELKTTWKPGTEIRFRTAWEDKVFEQWGTVLEFTPPESLKYTLFAPRPELEDKPENYFEMRYVLSDEGGKTRLEIFQEDNRSGAVQEAPQGEENAVLKGLKDLAENGLGLS
ncbi:MAG: SRPBCC domain-containing protein [Flavitalea sp.]